MSTLFSKARVAILGRLHELLDEVANTVPAYKQRIRDLEAALADLRASGDEAQGNVNSLELAIERGKAQVAELQADIDRLLGDNDPANDASALQLQATQLTTKKRIDTDKETLLQAASLRDEIIRAIDALDNKLQTMTVKLGELTLAEAATKAKNRAADAADAATAASDKAGSVDVGSIEAEIQRNKATADARFDRVIGGLTQDDPEQAVLLSKAKEALERRRAEIAASAANE